MFYSPGLLYLHLPRTGGTFVANLLEKQKIGGSRQLSMDVGGHDGVRSIPESTLDRSLVFTSLRDPWSWYASVDAHYRNKGNVDGFLHELFGKAVPFKDVLRTCTFPAQTSTVRLDKAVRFPGAHIPEERLLEKVSNSGVGLYTWMVLRMFCKEPFESVQNVGQILNEYGDVPWGIQAAIDTAQLRDGLLTVLDAWKPDVAAQIAPQLQTFPAMNEKGRFRGVTPGGQPDPSMYDLESQDWVRKADGWLMRRFGFDKPVGLRRPVTLLGSGQ